MSKTKHAKSKISGLGGNRYITGANADTLQFFHSGKAVYRMVGAGKEKFYEDDIDTMALIAPEVGDAPTQHVSGGRVAGGAVAGTVLLGPIGLLGGALLGAAAKATSGGNHALVLSFKDGRTLTMAIPSKRVPTAELFIRKFHDLPLIAPSEGA